MRSATIRQKFLQFFAGQGHQVVPSSPLVPAGDPTLLFTNAGMVQFKDVFLGREQRRYTRAATVQKCMRAGGKHNDLDQVGLTARHQTFFEMLGNFSFGDYFKAEAIRYAWTFLTQEIGIDPQAIWVTVYETDDEAYQLWQDIAGIEAERIVRLGEHDNFWSMGDTGPCGPSSEIFVDRGAHLACGPTCGIGQCECDRIQEIWNLVFMQFNRDAQGQLTPLPKPSIDTGMGLERIAAYLQGVDSNFETDLIFPLIEALEGLSGRRYDGGVLGMPFRVIADHVRAITFLVAEGVSFSNEGRGYVMRRILRRAMRFGRQLGFEQAFLYQLVPVVGQIMGDAYPEVNPASAWIAEVVREEEERFLVTLNAGLKVLHEKLTGIRPGDTLPGQDAFVLYDRYGFPLDLTKDVAREHGIGVDETGFDRLMHQQRERARANRNQTVRSLPDPGPSQFVGYERLTAVNEPVAALYVDQDPVERLDAGQMGWIYTPTTPFYPEGGGQVGDSGELVTDTGRAEIIDTLKSGQTIWHVGRVVSGYIVRGQSARLAVDAVRRAGAMRNHTGTHLLHAALRAVLGDAVHQTGSLVAPDRLRFDFAYPRPLTPDQMAQVEDLVNQWILEDRPVYTEEMPKEAALAQGALAFFEEKYQELVRVVTVPEASRELCGGTHCRSTGQIGLLAITEESSVGSGSRRVEAVTGFNAVAAFREARAVLGHVQRLLSAASTSEVPSKVQALKEELRAAQEELKERQRVEHVQRGRQLADRAEQIGGLNWVVEVVDGVTSLEALREVLDGLKGRVDGAVLFARHVDRASLVVYLGARVQARGWRAREVVREFARPIGGNGGGRDDVAQAGGRSPEGIAVAMESAKAWIVKNFHGVML